MANKEEIIAQFDPNAPGPGKGLFGLPFDQNQSEIIIIPVPWEVTVSYKAGTAEAPSAIKEASKQVDLFIKDIPHSWTLGISMIDINSQLYQENVKYRGMATKYINWLENNGQEWLSDSIKIIPKAVDEISEKLAIYIKATAHKYLQQGKVVGLLGGDHSTPLGLIRALGELHNSFGILQIDAHADLRKAYEDFTYSHASIMYNALQLPQVSILTQVAVRDLCEEEMQLIQDSPSRIKTFFDDDLKKRAFEGGLWKDTCIEIVNTLPKKVYISFDIDGLDAKYCPNAGTPVPGGLSYNEVMYLFRAVVKSGRKIIGFDLNEVAPGDNEWDANVGARILYQLSCLAGVSQGKLNIAL